MVLKFGYILESPGNFTNTDPIPRDTDLFDMGDGLGIMIFLKNFESEVKIETFIEEAQVMDLQTQTDNGVQEGDKARGHGNSGF